MQQVTVRVPASTSNLGPGFDCLGGPLLIYKKITVTRGAKSRPKRVVDEAADLFFHHARRASFSFSVSIAGNVPPSRGLGSSVTLRLGVLHALNALAGGRVDPLSLFQLCAQLEGHNAFAITAAFASGNYRNLRSAFADYLHQPYREKLIPFLPRVIAYAEKAGALGAFLSGSGSTICAITLQDRNKVAAAMKRCAGSTSTRTIITRADNCGARLIKSSMPNQVITISNGSSS